MSKLSEFLIESNAIEGIHERITDSDLNILTAFLELESIQVKDLENLVNHFQPGAVLRDKYGLDVYIGSHVPPKGSPYIRESLNALLTRINNGELSSYEAHIHYETLHPFTDGNGRSGRAIWLWMMHGYWPDLSFLHAFYYQSLQFSQQQEK